MTLSAATISGCKSVVEGIDCNYAGTGMASSYAPSGENVRLTPTDPLPAVASGRGHRLNAITTKPAKITTAPATRRRE